MKNQIITSIADYGKNIRLRTNGIAFQPNDVNGILLSNDTVNDCYKKCV